MLLAPGERRSNTACPNADPHAMTMTRSSAGRRRRLWALVLLVAWAGAGDGFQPRHVKHQSASGAPAATSSTSGTDVTATQGQDGADGPDLRFGGVVRLYGRQNFEVLRRSHACVVGVGGVGAWTAEALARTGLQRLTLVDLDELCISNVNRQVSGASGGSQTMRIVLCLAAARSRSRAWELCVCCRGGLTTPGVDSCPDQHGGGAQDLGVSRSHWTDQSVRRGHRSAGLPHGRHGGRDS